MAAMEIKRDGTYHVTPDGQIHAFDDCAPDCRSRGGTFPWIAAGTTVDPERIAARADEQPPTGRALP